MTADERGERMYTAVIDYLRTRKDVDAGRIGVQGVSLGGYWATKVAFAESARLKLAVNWAGPLDVSWSSEQLRRALGSREYLFDLPQALMTVWGYATPDALVAGQPKMSIVKQGLLGRPTPKMLVVNGLKDTLVPAPDTLLLLQTWAPKSAWLNPEGIHLGRLGRVEHQVDRRPQALRPSVNGTEARRSPVVAADALAHFTATHGPIHVDTPSSR